MTARWAWKALFNLPTAVALPGSLLCGPENSLIGGLAFAMWSYTVPTGKHRFVLWFSSGRYAHIRGCPLQDVTRVEDGAMKFNIRNPFSLGIRVLHMELTHLIR